MDEPVAAMRGDHRPVCRSRYLRAVPQRAQDRPRRRARLPSGKFATNALVVACAQLAYNLLRWIGQIGLLGRDAPPRRKAKRRRLRTVMQELMYVAARLIRTGRRLKLAFGWGCPALPVYRRLYAQLVGT